MQTMTQKQICERRARGMGKGGQTDEYRVYHFVAVVGDGFFTLDGWRPYA